MSEIKRATWRDYTIENYGEGTYDTCVLCRSDGGCEWLRSNAEGRYLTLGEAVDAAQEHVAWHAQQDAEEQELIAESSVSGAKAADQ